LISQKEAAGKEFGPTPIQAVALRPIYDGQSVILHAPTGTGKSLAFLLPLVQRLDKMRLDYNPRPGLRLLIVVPTADLQVQVTNLARTLVGPGRAESVSLIRRDQDSSASLKASIAVATPRQIMELLNNPVTALPWSKALAALEMVVVDEADRLVSKWNRIQRRKRDRQGLIDPCVALLQKIDNLTHEAGRSDDWQLVAASATVSRLTRRAIKFSSGIDLVLLRAEGAMLTQDGTEHSKGQYGDGTSSWPSGLRHTLRVVKPFQFPPVIRVVEKTIRELDARRCLVVTAASAYVSKATFGHNTITSYLRFKLPEFKVETCSAAVEAAAVTWSGSTDRARGNDLQREVVVGSSEAIRGIHLDNIDAVVLVGDPEVVNDYLHIAGRTCRYIPGIEQPRGTVVSVTPENTADKLVAWGELTGFKIVEVSLNQAHPRADADAAEIAASLPPPRVSRPMAERSKGVKAKDLEAPMLQERRQRAAAARAAHLAGQAAPSQALQGFAEDAGGKDEVEIAMTAGSGADERADSAVAVEGALASEAVEERLLVSEGEEERADRRVVMKEPPPSERVDAAVAQGVEEPPASEERVDAAVALEVEEPPAVPAMPRQEAAQSDMAAKPPSAAVGAAAAPSKTKAAAAVAPPSKDAPAEAPSSKAAPAEVAPSKAAPAEAVPSKVLVETPAIFSDPEADAAKGAWG